MTIAFPRTQYDFQLVGLTFFPEPMIEVTPLRSGVQVAVDIGPTLWRARYNTGPMNETKFGEARAWYDTLLSLQGFYGFDQLREYPLAYRANGFAGMTVSGSPFTGSATLSSTPSNKEVSLTNLPPGFVLSAGDYLSFDYGTSRALHRVSAGVVANGSGAVVSEVRPFIRPGATFPATVAVYRASALMIIVPGSYSEAAQAPTYGTLSFEAIQSL